MSPLGSCGTIVQVRHWTTWGPLVAAATLGLTWGRSALPVLVVAFCALALGMAVLAAVHHAEVIAHRVGEPFGSLILALAVTVIEVGLILMIMTGGGPGSSTLARDTVFAAVMITVNGMVGLSLLVAAVRGEVTYFNAEGAGAALSTVLTLTVLTLVLPTFTTSESGPRYTGTQLAFVAVVSLVLWGLFVVTQTVRHREFFLPVNERGEILESPDQLAAPTGRAVVRSVALLLVALISVVGLAKVVSPSIEVVVAEVGLPRAVVGVLIALLVLAPETLASVRNAARGRTQVSLNLAYGSGIASIGLTIPAIAMTSLFVDTDLILGLSLLQITLLVLTAAASVLTVVPGRATRLQGGVHLVIFAAFVFLTGVP